ncbi:MAG TPA: SLBB domain-containing protein, partial [Terriglobales bacterium]|nr:SLBB domain-containing protein [Terriglobales bacterium]
VQVTPDYILGPGDQLVIRGWGQVDINVHPVVDRSGAIYIPKVGVIHVAGVRYADLHDYLQAAIARTFKNFELDVTMGQLRSIQIFVVGQVRRPGSYTVSSLSSLVDALFVCGGPAKRGSMRRIELKRNGQTVTTFDLYDLLLNGDKSKDAKLLPGDVIYVPAVGPLVAMAGSVNNPAIYELKDITTLADVIHYAGGLATTAEGDHAVVERIDDHRVRQEERFPLTPQGMAMGLRDGDIIHFPQITPKFENAITLRGNVARPGRYPWRVGMRVSDLIPSRESLVTREYWEKKNELGVPPARPSEMATPAQPSAVAPTPRIGQAELKNEIKRLESEINWEYAVVERFDLDNLSSHLLPFNLARAIEGDPSQNLPLQPGDVVTIFSQADIQVPIGQQSKFVRLEGELPRAGVYEVQPGETLRHLVERVGGITPQAYLFGAELDRESTRVEQQRRIDDYVAALEASIAKTEAALGANAISDPNQVALAQQRLQSQQGLASRLKDVRATGRIVLEVRPDAGTTAALPELVLEDGDRLLIPYRPATVEVIGNVYTSGSFLYRPGKTVADYLRLAGGPSRQADKGHIFVIRANGATVAKSGWAPLTGRSLEEMRLMPGDTVVVPQNFNPGAFLRGLRDVTQIFTQFALGAAAVHVLFQ